MKDIILLILALLMFCTVSYEIGKRSREHLAPIASCDLPKPDELACAKHWFRSTNLEEVKRRVCGRK